LKSVCVVDEKSLFALCAEYILQAIMMYVIPLS